jgi:hypothetical protein
MQKDDPILWSERVNPRVPVRFYGCDVHHSIRKSFFAKAGHLGFDGCKFSPTQQSIGSLLLLSTMSAPILIWSRKTASKLFSATLFRLSLIFPRNSNRKCLWQGLGFHTLRRTRRRELEISGLKARVNPPLEDLGHF